ncbi:MAG: long-chain-fatty-acid--CoA ligase [Planctomycetota bacterium]
MDIWSLLLQARAAHPGKTGVVEGDLRLTYAEVAERAESLAGFLSERGIGPGDRVAVVEENTHAFLEAYFAAAALGAVLVPLNHRLSHREIGFILEDSGARWLLATERCRARVERAGRNLVEGVLWLGEEYEDALGSAREPFTPAPVEADQPAHLYYTSGTTGRPKGVVLTHGNVCVHSANAVEELEITEADVWGHFAPMFHLADAWATFAITSVGGTHVMVPRFGPDAVLDAVERERVTVSNLIPSMLNLLLKHPRTAAADLSSFRVVLSGGAPIAPELVRRTMRVFGCDYIQTYGMTETSPYLTLSILDDRQRELPAEDRFALKAKTGRPMKGVRLEVVDDEGRPVPGDDRTVGEIRVRGETVTPGYWNRPEETAAAFADGWLMTGDLAVVDGEGFVNIVDRKKDMIITGGENVYSTEVENVLYEHPEVLEAAVFGVPDEEWGEAVAAAVALRGGRETSAEEITLFCRDRMAGFKVPKHLVLLPDLPKTGTGKISKRALRERYQCGF